MGSTASHHHTPRKSVSSGSSPPPITTEVDSPPELSDQQKVLLRETWKELEDNIAKVGVITFISLFETHPDVQAVFMPFSGLPLDELKQSKQLRAHALRVMAFVQKAVARLHEPEKLQTLLQELGMKHYHYGAQQQYVDAAFCFVSGFLYVEQKRKYLLKEARDIATVFVETNSRAARSQQEEKFLQKKVAFKSQLCINQLIGPQFIQAIQPSLEDRWTPELQQAWAQLFHYIAFFMKASMEKERLAVEQ